MGRNLDALAESDFIDAMWAAGINPEDVYEIVHSRLGYNDDYNWLYVVELNTGRFAYVSSWCDYTGWDCQSGGWSAEADTLEELVPKMDTEGRQVFGYEPMPDCGL